MSAICFLKILSYLKSYELREFSEIKNECLHRAIQLLLASTVKIKKKYYYEEKREYESFIELAEIMKIDKMVIKSVKSSERSNKKYKNEENSEQENDNMTSLHSEPIVKKKKNVKNKKKEKNNNVNINNDNDKTDNLKDLENDLENDLEKEVGSIITTDDEGNEIIDLAKIKTTTPILNVGDVLLKCVKEGSKLRVKIISEGYFNDANCQFPKDIRKEGRIFKVKAKDIQLAEGKAGKYFYRVKSGIEIYNEGNNLLPSDVTKVKIYEDKKDSDCAVCLSVPKTTVIVPCGHFYTCNSCARQLDKCPICRGGITKLIDKTKME